MELFSPPSPSPLPRSLQVILVKWMCGVFTASFTGVVKYHGPRPVKRPHQVGWWGKGVGSDPPLGGLVG